MSEINPSERMALTDVTDVIQWKGKRGSFNTLVMDQRNLKYIYSSIDNNKAVVLQTGKLISI